MITRMRCVYLAARYSRRMELCGYRAELEMVGIKVTSRWLNGSRQLDNYGIPITDEGERRFQRDDPQVDYLRAHFALEDTKDVLAADTLIAFTEQPRATNSRGGRHVELGMAIAAVKNIVVIGPREHVFCWLPHINNYTDWQSFRLVLSKGRCPEQGCGRTQEPCAGCLEHENDIDGTAGVRRTQEAWWW